MKRFQFIILIFIIACSYNAPRYYITYESDRTEIEHSEIGTFTIKTDPIKIMGDSLFVRPNVLVFGNDPSIRLVYFDPSKHLSIWGQTTAVEFIVLEPDTFAFSLHYDETILEDRIFIGFIERGNYFMRYRLNDWHPSGKYLFRLTVGEETKKIVKVYLED